MSVFTQQTCWASAGTLHPSFTVTFKSADELQACDSLVYNDNHIINALFTTTSQE